VAIPLSLIPVVLFLSGLLVFDSFKLIRYFCLLQCIGWGLVAAALALFLNLWLQEYSSNNYLHFSRYIAPIVEETLKAIFMVWLVVRKRTGFTIDAAIYGFSIGTGFALAENIHAIVTAPANPGWGVWLLRGFGTATMHGGCTALFAVLFIHGIQRRIPNWLSFLPAWIIALFLHSGYNHFIFNPLLQTALILIVLPAILTIVFYFTTRSLRNWLEVKFINEIELLGMLRSGKITESNTGAYLKSLQRHIKPELLLDIYCYLSLYLELSIAAKRNILLKECGFPAIISSDIPGKLQEFKHLGARIGKTGKLALQPLLNLSQRELWNINQLRN
jgi:protease PrsW